MKMLRIWQISLILMLFQSGARGSELTFDFKDTLVGERPEGWRSFHPDSNPEVSITSVENSNHVLKGRRSDFSQLTALVRDFETPQKRILIEFDLAVSESDGRAFHIWTYEPDGRDASQLNLATHRGHLRQYAEGTWVDGGFRLTASKDLQDPVWHRIRALVDSESDSVNFWFAKPGESIADDAPPTTRIAYRTDLLIGGIGFVSGTRIAEDAWYLVDNVSIRTGDDLPKPIEAEPLPEQFPLWSGDDIPNDPEQIPFAAGLENSTLHRAAKGKFQFLHGAAIVDYKGTLFANWANSPVNENGPHETLQGRRSYDGGKTWPKLEVIGPGFDGPDRHSHGVLFPHQGELWTICARFGVGEKGRVFPGLEGEAFVLDEKTDEWQSRGIVMDNCWPYDPPVKMANGNYITGGQDRDGLPVVAISHGENFLKWDSVLIPYHPRLRPSFAETTVWAEGDRVIAVIRGSSNVAWVSESQDYGRTWSIAGPSNYPMPRAKAFLGKLSTGQLFVVSNFRNRDTLVVSAGKPGEMSVSKMWRVRHGESEPPLYEGFAKSKQWSYPYAHEYDGKLYVVYSIGKEDCGLTVIPIESLAVDAPEQKTNAGGLMLNGDWLPEDPHQIDYEKLPRVPAKHAIISDVRDQGGTRVHQHAYLAHHDGQFWAMWSDGPGLPKAGATPEQHRNIVPGHDRPDTRNSFSTSSDGLEWSPPADLTGPPRIEGYGWIARGLWKRDGELLALASHFNAPGYAGLGLSLEAFRWNGTKWVAHGTVLDDSMNNFPPKRLPSGEWMMTRRDHQRQVSVMIGGTKAFDDWRINPLAAYDGGGRPEEPYWYILPDEKTIVGLIRDNGGSKFLLRTFSRNNGKTWSKIHRTNFPDATSKFFVHRTSRGYYVMVSNSNPRRRDPLTLAISEDGLTFTKLFWLIGGRHIDYPHIIEHDGHLLVAFSGAKQTMEVMQVSLDDLERLQMPESVALAQPLPTVKVSPQQPADWIDLGDKGKTLYAAADLVVPELGTRASFSLTTARGEERVVLGIDAQGQLTARLYKETVTGPKLKPGSRHSVLMRIHSHHTKADELLVHLGAPGQIPSEPEQWTLSNATGSSSANLSGIALHGDSAGFENIRIAPTRNALEKAKAVN